MQPFVEVHFEVTTFCNFRCNFCPIDSIKRGQVHMPSEVAQKIIGGIADSNLAPRVAFHQMGEPLLHPKIKEILQFSNAKGLKNRVVTNGYLLGKSSKALKAISHCQILDISLRISSEREFNETSKAGSYGQYLAGLKTFINDRANYGDFLTRIRLFRNEKTLGMLKSVGMNLDQESIDSHTDEIELAPDLVILLESCLDWRGDRKTYLARPFAHCTEFNTGFSVLANGEITTCCWDYDGENSLGNFFENGSLTSILQGDSARSFLTKFRYKLAPTSFCAKCLARPTLLKYAAYQAAVLLGLR